LSRVGTGNIKFFLHRIAFSAGWQRLRGKSENNRGRSISMITEEAKFSFGVKKSEDGDVFIVVRKVE
jgi:hypothetical protein